MIVNYSFSKAYLILGFCVIMISYVLGGVTSKPMATEAVHRQQDPKCLLPMEPGPCRMNLERFYYNPKTNTCEVFKFGGCRGNDNKFGFRQTCEEACKQTGSITTTTVRTVVPTVVSTSTTTKKPNTMKIN